MIDHVKHIIVADDDEDDIEMFMDAAGEHCPDLTISVASDGEKLIAMLQVTPAPYAIFLDLNMPCKNGKECLLQIRSMPVFSKVPVIIFSTSNLESEKIYCLNNGANHYIVKPLSYNGMKTIILNLCKGKFSLCDDEEEKVET